MASSGSGWRSNAFRRQASKRLSGKAFFFSLALRNRLVKMAAPAENRVAGKPLKTVRRVDRG
jgi:hypothetical protein